MTSFSSAFCSEARHNSSIGPTAGALWPVPKEPLLCSQPRAAHATKASSTGTAWQHSWKPAGAKGCTGCQRWALLTAKTLQWVRNLTSALRLSFMDGSASALPAERPRVSGGDVAGDLTKIPLTSGPLDIKCDIKLLPCKPAPASSGLSSSSAMQAAHIHKLLVLHIPSLQAAEYPSSSEGAEENILHSSLRPQRWWSLSVRGDNPNICLIFKERYMAHPSFQFMQPLHFACSCSKKFLAACSSMDVSKRLFWQQPKSPLVTLEKWIFPNPNHLPHLGTINLSLPSIPWDTEHRFSCTLCSAVHPLTFPCDFCSMCCLNVLPFEEDWFLTWEFLLLVPIAYKQTGTTARVIFSFPSTFRACS